MVNLDRTRSPTTSQATFHAGADVPARRNSLHNCRPTVAFLDEEEDELPLPEPPARPTRPPRPPRAPRQQLLIRRLIAVGVGILFLILIVIGIKGCLNARKERAIKDFGTRAGSLVVASDQVGDEFFKLLDSPSTSDTTQFGTQVKSFRGATDSQYQRLQSLGAPSEMSTAKQSLETTFALRRTAMAVIADNVDQAFAKEGAIEAQHAIADQMKLLYASDQVYSGVVLPEINSVISDQGISDFPAMPTPCASSLPASSSSSGSSSSASSDTTSTPSSDSTISNPFATTSGSSSPEQ